MSIVVTITALKNSATKRQLPLISFDRDAS